MEIFHTALEAHSVGATIYVVGFLCDDAVARATELMVGVPNESHTIRLDLRAVHFIDPHAFVVLSRTLNRWRDARRGRVTIEFPRRSSTQASRKIRVVDQLNTTGMAVSTAIN